MIVDASVAVKWLVEENGTAAAGALLASHAGDLRAPDMLMIEVAGAISSGW